MQSGVVCPGTRRHTSAGADTTPGVEYAATKSARYADQHNFVPFIVETGGRVNCAGIQFLDLLSGVAGLANAAPVLVDGRPSRFGVVALAHRRKRAALSGVLRELTLLSCWPRSWRRSPRGTTRRREGPGGSE